MFNIERFQQIIDKVINPPTKEPYLTVSVEEFDFLASVENKKELTQDEIDRYYLIKSRTYWR